MFKKEKFAGKKACVLGLGKSGRAVAHLLAHHGFSVLVSEDAPVAHVESFAFPPEVQVETGGNTERIFACDFWVKSPGLSPRHPVLVEAKKRKIPVFSELEVGLAFMPKQIRVFAVTGTNGKTTTTALLGEILKEQTRQTGHTVHVCGNIG